MIPQPKSINGKVEEQAKLTQGNRIQDGSPASKTWGIPKTWYRANNRPKS